MNRDLTLRSVTDIQVETHSVVDCGIHAYLYTLLMTVVLVELCRKESSLFMREYQLRLYCRIWSWRSA